MEPRYRPAIYAAARSSAGFDQRQRAAVSPASISLCPH